MLREQALCAIDSPCLLPPGGPVSAGVLQLADLARLARNSHGGGILMAELRGPIAVELSRYSWRSSGLRAINAEV